MTPIQQLYLGVGAKKKTYMEDVFSTYLWRGTGSAQAINNGINLSTEGGMVWIKDRVDTNDHWLFDTANGADWAVRSNLHNARYNTGSPYMSSFNSNGFSIGTQSQVNDNNSWYTSWSFRKTKGFFDVVTYNGNATSSSSPARQIAHNLGSVPGCIMIKCTSQNQSWAVYHRDTGNTKYLMLNADNAVATSSAFWGDTDPTDTHFTVKHDGQVNENGHTYVAYIFAGGESTAATARSVAFDGNDHLSLAATNAFHLTGDLTIEGWFYPDSFKNYDRLFCIGNYEANGGVELSTGSAGQLYFYTRHANSEAVRITTSIEKEQWSHIAIVRSGSKVTMYVNGTYRGSYTQSEDFGASNNKNLRIGAAENNSGVADYFTGKISNFRIVKGTAVYTASFRPPTAPLTNITNTNLLCCNNSSVAGSTVTPDTITSNGDPTASSDSPFDDPEGFAFGDTGDQQAIKCSSYVGNGSSTGPEVFVGFEPQWVLIKRASDTEDWMIFDSMRGWVTSEGDRDLRPNVTGTEGSGTFDWLDLTSTGFKIKCTANHLNGVNDDYVYVAIRRPDGYVGKPIETGTDAFNVVYGNSSSTIPNFASNFPVDIGIYKEPASTYGWYLHTRMTGNKALRTDTDSAQGSSDNDATFDVNAGWGKFGYNTDKASWQWRRHAGLDVVCYKGTDAARWLPHNLNAVPQMIWVKRRTPNMGNWWVYHVGANGGVSPHAQELVLNTDAAQAGTNFWEPPTSTHFYIGGSSHVSDSGNEYLVCLFSSVTGVSKVGYFDGSDSEQTITTGFQPRFVIIKRASAAGSWVVLDTLRGWASGNDQRMKLNDDDAQESGADVGAPTSTGFTLTGNQSDWSDSGSKYIYYAHS